ncbi:alpha-2 adrenergic receptor [Trichonephila clavipes]|nr:alpha-2 adrenergic receptor [Trichonephila clavipes]
MCCLSCNGSQEPFFNKAVISLIRQGCHKTVSALLLPFLALPNPQICLQSSLSGMIWGRWASHEFERTRDKLLDILIVQFRNEKVSNHGSIPITIDCNVVGFIVFEEGFHQPLKRTHHSVSLDVKVLRHPLVFTPNAALLFVNVAIQPEVRFIAKQNSLMKIGNNGHLVLGPFDESTPCSMIVWMNCQTKLRINHLTAAKSVSILESNANLNFCTWEKNTLY